MKRILVRQFLLGAYDRSVYNTDGLYVFTIFQRADSGLYKGNKT